MVALCNSSLQEGSKHTLGEILFTEPLTPKALRLKIAQKPYIVWSLGPKALKDESLEPQGRVSRAEGAPNRVYGVRAAYGKLQKVGNRIKDSKYWDSLYITLKD